MPTEPIDEQPPPGVGRAIGLGVLVMLGGTVPRNVFFGANLRVGPCVPWAVPVTGLYLWFFWHYLGGTLFPSATTPLRRACLRSNRVRTEQWWWSLIAGVIAIAALVAGLRVLNRLVLLPEQRLPSFDGVPWWTVWALLIAAAPVAGLVEEAAFRGYMQGPIERTHGVPIAILITGTIFALSHLDFTPVLWPYYVAVAAIYGMVTRLTNSVWPAVVLHTGGNLYSNTDLLLHGRSDWQAGAGGTPLIWDAGVDTAFVGWFTAFLLLAGVSLWAYSRLAAAGRAADAPLASATPRD
jgi:membrane protease YdiL (CAAX protease family)